MSDTKNIATGPEASQAESFRVDGKDLRVGDTIDVLGRRQTIVAIKTYDGRLDLWAGKARIATFAAGFQMTIEPEGWAKVYSRAPEAAHA